MANLNVMGESLADQFRGLKGRHPGQWPIMPRLLLAMLAMAVVIGAGWGFYWNEQLNEQERGKAKENTLKDEYRVKIQQAVNLDILQAQKKQVNAYVTSLEKQLPGKAQIENLLSDINTAGVGRGLHIESIKPGSVVINDYYSELPIEIKVSGSYHDIGAFTGDIANLSRIVTLNSLELIANREGNGLTLNATAKTFRYLDSDELAETRKTMVGKKKGEKK